jgi:hypothetical protein
MQGELIQLFFLPESFWIPNLEDLVLFSRIQRPRGHESDRLSRYNIFNEVVTREAW